MIQRTMFNKLSIDRIEEVFAQHFGAQLASSIQQWREWVRSGQVKGRSFYIFLNDQLELDGVLLHHPEEEAGTIFARSAEAAQNLVERAREKGAIKTLNGDSESCKWGL